jgi:hypothetical protein
MFSFRVPAPLWLALIGFTGLAVGPEIDSSAANFTAPAVVAPCPPTADSPEQDARYWQGYRDASRRWSAPNPAARIGRV